MKKKRTMKERFSQPIFEENISHWMLTIITGGVEKIDDFDFDTSEKAHNFLIGYIGHVLSGIIKEFNLYDENIRKRYNLKHTLKDLTDVYDYDVVSHELKVKDNNLKLETLESQAGKLVSMVSELNVKLNLGKPEQMFGIWPYSE